MPMPIELFSIELFSRVMCKFDESLWGQAERLKVEPVPSHWHRVRLADARLRFHSAGR